MCFEVNPLKICYPVRKTVIGEATESTHDGHHQGQVEWHERGYHGQQGLDARVRQEHCHHTSELH